MEWEKLEAAAMAMGVVEEEENEVGTVPHDQTLRKQGFGSSAVSSADRAIRRANRRYGWCRRTVCRTSPSAKKMN